MFNAREIIDIAIVIEQNAERRYRSASRHARNSALKDLLDWVANEELIHVDRFQEIGKQIQQPGGESLASDAGITDEFVDIISGNASFSLEDIDFSKVKTISDLLTIFIEFEKDTVLFYEMLSAFVIDEEASRKIRVIIEEEEKHIEKFRIFSGQPVKP